MSGTANALCQLNSPLGNFMKEANESVTKGEHQLHPPPWARDLGFINRRNGFDTLKIEVGHTAWLQKLPARFFRTQQHYSWRMSTLETHRAQRGPPQSSLSLGSCHVAFFQGWHDGKSLATPDIYPGHSQWSSPGFPLKYLQFTLKSFSF